MRGGAVVARRAHNPKVIGSSPVPATNILKRYSQAENTFFNFQEMYILYILYSTSSGKTYVGQTSDLEKRLVYHNITGIKTYTSKYRPWILMYTEELLTRKEAMKKERWYKSGIGRFALSKLKADFLAERCEVESAFSADSSSGS